MHENSLIFASSFALLCEMYRIHLERKLERKYRQSTGCRKATTGTPLSIIVNIFSHLNDHKYKSKLRIKITIKYNREILFKKDLF